MDKTVRNKWQVRAAALLVFALGFAAGGLALHSYRSWARAGGGDGGGREHRRAAHFERMLERLELSEEQEPRVRQILTDTRDQVDALRRDAEPRFEEVRRQADARLREVLTPEQWEEFQRMKREGKGRGRSGRRGGGGGDNAGPPPPSPGGGAR
jgi:Spy/CpxP family protein refolding chaperone